MVKIPVLLAAFALVAAGAAHAQAFKWVDSDGKLRYGDVPPPGVKATPLKGVPAAPAPPAASAEKAKDAKKGPLTPAEQEQEYRKRQAEAQKAAAKAEQEQSEKATKQQNCEAARESLLAIESGQRIARTDAKGERYYLEEAQLAQEASRMRQAVQQACK